MTRVYIAGPYSADNVMDVLHNIRLGIDMSYKVFCEGMAPFCPWLDFHYVLRDWQHNLGIDDFYKYSLAWLEVSDAVLVIGNWQLSAGTRNEVAYALKHEIPVFYELANLIKWKEKENGKT